MRIALLSESPTLPTGFARTSRLIADALVESGNDVICYAIGAWGETFRRENYAYTVWAAGDFEDNHHQKFLSFMRHISPDVVIINYDLISVLSWIQMFEQTDLNCPIIAHLVIDGLPVDPLFLRPLKRCEAIIVPTNCVAEYINKHLGRHAYVFPHLVDTSIFRPCQPRLYRDRLLQSRFLIGTFAQNRTRKQLVQVVAALRLLRNSGVDCGLIIHTDRANATRLGGDNLKRVVRYLDVEAHTRILESRACLDVTTEHNGHGFPLDADPLATVIPSPAPLHELINLCDVVIVASACGGFEYSIIESQACGVPVCSTNDEGIMCEVAGGATRLLNPSLYDFTSYGSNYFRIAPSTIAEAAAQLLRDPQACDGLREAGKLNSLRYDKDLNLPRLRGLMTAIFNGGQHHEQVESAPDELE